VPAEIGMPTTPSVQTKTLPSLETSAIPTARPARASRGEARQAQCAVHAHSLPSISGEGGLDNPCSQGVGEPRPESLEDASADSARARETAAP